MDCPSDPDAEIREPVEIRAIPVAVSADACILSGESGHWGNLRRLDTGAGGGGL